MKTTFATKSTTDKMMYILHDLSARWHQIVLLMVFIKKIALSSFRILRRCWNVIQEELNKSN